MKSPKAQVKGSSLAQPPRCFPCTTKVFVLLELGKTRWIFTRRGLGMSINLAYMCTDIKAKCIFAYVIQKCSRIVSHY